jgi:hypothetical protein
LLSTEEATVVSVSAPGQPIGLGQEFFADIVVGREGTVADMQFDLNLDSPLVTVDEIEEGNMLTQDIVY